MSLLQIYDRIRPGSKFFALFAIMNLFLSSSEVQSFDHTIKNPDHGWIPVSPRGEIRPNFSQQPGKAPTEEPIWVIQTGASIADHGWFQRSFPVKGGSWYQFGAIKKTKDVESPNRSAPARIVWQDAQGKPVRANVPPNKSGEKAYIPLAEPEHPMDGSTNAEGWTEVRGVYQAPDSATQALVELHLQWAPKGTVQWSRISLMESTAPAPRKVRLATAHYVPTGKSVERNREEYWHLILAAKAKGADLIVLGETINHTNLGKKPHEVAEPIPGPTTNYFSDLAKNQKIHIVVGLYERHDTVVYNSACLIGPDGMLVGTYRKVCLPHSEIEDGVTPGKNFPVFDTKLGKVGMMICYDGFFPEVARGLALNGAEIVAWPVAGCNPLLSRARACENHIFLVSSTYTDSKANWTISAIYDRDGTPLAQADKWNTIAISEVDLSRPHFWRNNLGDFRSMIPRHRP